MDVSFKARREVNSLLSSASPLVSSLQQQQLLPHRVVRSESVDNVEFVSS
jgi:hypothetical protein